MISTLPEIEVWNMTKAYAQMNSSCTAANGAGFAARAFALILILVDIALAVSIIICLDSLLALGLILVAIILGALGVRTCKRCRRTVG